MAASLSAELPLLEQQCFGRVRQQLQAGQRAGDLLLIGEQVDPADVLG